MICVFCLTPLPNQSDQYGPIQAPLCQSCWNLDTAVQCPNCSTGKLTCVTCDGSGGNAYDYDCADCYGEGWNPCDVCGGDGRITAMQLYSIPFNEINLAELSEAYANQQPRSINPGQLMLPLEITPS